MKNKIAYSENTKTLLGAYSYHNLEFASILLFGIGVMFAFFGNISVFVVTIVLIVAMWVLIFIPNNKKLKEKRDEIIAINEKDFLASKEIETLITDSFVNMVPLDFEKSEQLGADWTPYRLDKSIPDATKEEMLNKRFFGGFVNLKPFLNKEIFYKRYNYLETCKIPEKDILENSSVLYLENTKGEKMKIFIPSKKILFEDLLADIARMIYALNTISKYYLTADFGGKISETHIFSVLTFYITHLGTKCLSGSCGNILDEIEYSLEIPKDNRDKVKIFGDYTSPGIAYASSIEYKGEKKFLLPVGMLFEMRKQILQAIKKHFCE